MLEGAINHHQHQTSSHLPIWIDTLKFASLSDVIGGDHSDGRMKDVVTPLARRKAALNGFSCFLTRHRSPNGMPAGRSSKNPFLGKLRKILNPIDFKAAAKVAAGERIMHKLWRSYKIFFSCETALVILGDETTFAFTHSQLTWGFLIKEMSYANSAYGTLECVQRATTTQPDEECYRFVSVRE